MKIKAETTTPSRFRLDKARGNRNIMSTALSLLLSYPSVWGRSMWPICLITGILGTALTFLFHLKDCPPIVSQIAGILILSATAAAMVVISHQILANGSLSESGRLMPFIFNKVNMKALFKNMKKPFVIFFLISLLVVATAYVICSFPIVPDPLLIPAMLLAVLLWLPLNLMAYHHLSFLPATEVGMKFVKTKPARQYGNALLISICSGTLFLLVTFIIALPFGILHVSRTLSEYSIMAGDASDMPGYIPFIYYLISIATVTASNFFLLFIILPYHLLSYSIRCSHRPKL